jgi:tetratricopeptide (TPR) repeat protein
MNEFSIKKKAEINWTFIIRAVACFLFCAIALFIIAISTGAELFTFTHYIIFVICAIPFSLLYAYIVEKLGSGLGVIFSGWTAKKISPMEQLSADLARARYSKGRGDFEDALQIINQVLEKDPEFHDALYLKAHILWEGFHNSTEASECLTRVMELVRNHNEPLYRWALNYSREVKKGPVSDEFDF